MADIKAALAHARLVAKTAGNTGNTRNTENNSSDIKPLGAIGLAATNQERLATPATQAGGGLLPTLPLAKSGNVEVATKKTLVKQDHDSKPNDESVDHDASRAPTLHGNAARMDAMKPLTLR
jgi:hypothetical protein